LPIGDCIRTAHSRAIDARAAAREFHAQVVQPDTALVVFFCSSEYELEALAEEMNRLFAGVLVVGCTTAGEIGPSGYRDRSLCGASFPGAAFVAATGHLDHLQQFELAAGRSFAQGLMQQLEARAADANPDNSFAMLLIDGLSVREEPVTHVFQQALGRIPLIGGSAGDDLRFSRTCVFHDGAFRSDSAVLILVSSAYRVKTFKTQHFVGKEERLVVTAADAANRVVSEINGLPAAEEYARLVGVEVGDLDSMCFAASPLVIRIDGTDFVRSIQKSNPDGSLTFYCAIDEGLVLRLARGVDLLANLGQTFDDIAAEIGNPQLVLGCDCILRNLEISRTGLKEAVGELFRRNNVVGFSTYGEQFGGVHVNQTFTGIAIGAALEQADG